MFLFKAKLARKMCLTLWLREKNAFLDYKNKKSKKSKVWDFSKGVSPWVW